MEGFRPGLRALIGVFALETAGCGPENTGSSAIPSPAQPNPCSPDIQNFIADNQTQDTLCIWDYSGSQIQIRCTFVTPTTNEDGQCAVNCTANKGKQTGSDTLIISLPTIQNNALSGQGTFDRSTGTKHLGIAPTVCAK